MVNPSPSRTYLWPSLHTNGLVAGRVAVVGSPLLANGGQHDDGQLLANTGRYIANSLDLYRDGCRWTSAQTSVDRQNELVDF